MIDKPEPTTLKENKECVSYWRYIYFDKGDQVHSNQCRLVDGTTTCGTLRKNRKCPRLRSEYPVKHNHTGKQLHLGGYRS